MNEIHRAYLNILNLPVRKPDLNYLNEIISSHLYHIPFENISKIYYKIKYGYINIPDYDEYIRRISQYHFGGTCYSLNYYLNLLLTQLGFNTILCGADMINPDVHLVSIVKLDSREYIVDAGYAAPFFEALPRDLKTEYEINFGYDKYIVLPKDLFGHTRINQFRNNILRHSYIVKPYPRLISDFNEVIKASYDPSATFMNSILLTRYGRKSSFIINDLSAIELNESIPSKKELSGKDELINEIVVRFRIPLNIVREVIDHMKQQKLE